MDLRVTKPVNATGLLKIIDEKCSEQESEFTGVIDAHDSFDNVQPIKAVETTSNSSIDPEQIQYLRSIGNNDFLGEMIAGFHEDIAETQPQFKKAAEESDLGQFRFCAHAFKSSANNIGARRLAEISGNLEAISEAEFRNDRFDYLEKVETELEAARLELDQIATGTLSQAG